MDWYYSAEGRPVGPHSADDIESLFVTGQINASTLVWRKGMPQWSQLSEAPEFSLVVADELPPPLPPRTQAPVKSDDEVLVEDRVEDTDEIDREPVFNFNKASVAPDLAGPWTRYFARSIDLSVDHRVGTIDADLLGASLDQLRRK